MALLEVSRISKQQEGELVLDDISFDQDSGEQIAIAGESGAGKTTLLRVIAGLVQPDRGQVLFNAGKVQGPLEKLVPGHPRIAYLSQHFDLRNNYRVEEILRYANELSEIDASNLYEICRIDHLLKRWTHQVSGGEKQRIALARLLTTAPRLLLLDEPYSNLDPILKNILKTVIQDLGEKLQITCLLTSHDPNDTLSWANQIMVMKSGKIIQQGSPGEIYRFPINEYAAGLFGRYISVDAPLVSAFPSLESTIQFLRPENFILTRDPQGSIQASVAAVRYMGSYDEVEVIIPGNTTVTVRHHSNEIRKGEQIFLSLRN